MTDADPNLDWSPERFRALADETLDRLVAHLVSLPDQPASGDLRAEALCRSMRGPAPERPSPLGPLLDRLFDHYIPRSYTTSGPGYMGYIPGGGILPAALADLIADVTNRYTGVWHAAPALVQLEANALGWLRDWMGFPATTRGLFTTGGSMANFNAIVCARERLLGPDLRLGTLYTSSQAHHSIAKSAKLAGILPDRVRMIPVNSSFRMRVEALSEAIDADRRLGLRPFLVAATAGTTYTGAVDPLEGIADLCAREGLWHHIDGAYGAFFHTSPALRPLLAGLPRADSLTLDPHKGLFLPYGTGALLVRDGEALHLAHAATASYMAPVADPEEFYDPCQYGPDLSRGFPGLRVWLTVSLLGASNLRAAIEEKRTLAVEAAEAVTRLPGVRIVARPQLSLFAFHLTGPGLSLADENAATRLLLGRVLARGRVMLTGCTIDSRFLARVCILSFRTRREHVETCLSHIAEEAAAILGGAGGPSS